MSRAVNGADPLAFGVERDDQTTSWRRAQDEGTIIRQRTNFGFVVRLTQSDEAHTCYLARDGDEYRGKCTCKGYEYNRGPCAHLCALRVSERRGVVEIAQIDEALASHDCPMCGRPMEDTDL